eukprot:CAMPEP_0197442628 /NCGR_PEP_ID=MMETSP1175-20131217/8603_1 /TAXON_ID=1003142 /ORGANISM="Triceratium dubium, Strain CCMP147" /LENGTH=105 /DNA_ID=CAMNT_0042973139 /DNA_START=656 /DNA_END=970 /DNA_ORIENTATION=+
MPHGIHVLCELVTTQPPHFHHTKLKTCTADASLKPFVRVPADDEGEDDKHDELQVRHLPFFTSSDFASVQVSPLSVLRWTGNAAQEERCLDCFALPFSPRTPSFF